MTTLFKPLEEKGETTFFTIFDVMYSYACLHYGCGILSYKIETGFNANTKIIKFYNDGFPSAAFFCNTPVEALSNAYMLLMWQGKQIPFGSEPFTLEELKEIVLGKKSKKFTKILKRANSQN